MTQDQDTRDVADPGVTPAFAEHRVPVGQGSIHVRDYAGAGPAFVLMHGFPDNSHIYDDLIPYLVAGGRRVVAFDFLGFGASDKPTGAAYSFAQQLGDLKTVVDHLDLGKVVPVAHDSSGIAAVNFAIDHPESVASLVILNAAFANAPTVHWPELITLFATPELHALSSAILQAPEQFGWIVNVQREAFKAALADQHKARYDGFLGPVIDANFRVQGAGPAFAQMTAQFFAELTRNDARLALMEALDVPAKVIWGANDPYINAGVAEDFASHLRHASLRILPAGHWLQIDEPELVAAEMLA
ncbi:alpha/beta hydrolase [Sphingomonas sp. dw_22]|uniref:alpha/beta fold hydrolase n=1 Tax=Sphingomonas sp. dw_22 TaxID=2721175 RepID=UPI001BD6709F|nr:alpha/beta hydrolase [Sphingomonas sp. dw_22]